MKHIVKRSEPAEFIQWKAQATEDWTPKYDGVFQNPEKAIVHRALLEEQGYICCYCTQGVDIHSSHIEHLVAQSEHIPGLDLEYSNLLCSCGPEREKRVEPAHCGEEKSNASISITPLQPDCETRFAYTSDGAIDARPPNAGDARDTIKILGLDCPKVTRNRKDAIRSWVFDASDTLLTEGELRRIRDSILQRDTNNRFPPFCVVVAYIIDGLLP